MKKRTDLLSRLSSCRYSALVVFILRKVRFALEQKNVLATAVLDLVVGKVVPVYCEPLLMEMPAERMVSSEDNTRVQTNFSLCGFFS